MLGFDIGPCVQRTLDILGIDLADDATRERSVIFPPPSGHKRRPGPWAKVCLQLRRIGGEVKDEGVKVRRAASEQKADVVADVAALPGDRRPLARPQPDRAAARQGQSARPRTASPRGDDDVRAPCRAEGASRSNSTGTICSHLKKALPAIIKLKTGEAMVLTEVDMLRRCAARHPARSRRGGGLDAHDRPRPAGGDLDRRGRADAPRLQVDRRGEAVRLGAGVGAVPARAAAGARSRVRRDRAQPRWR